jgi:hypothetical protein
VEAGGWLGALSRRLEAHELRAVVRQRDVSARDALADLHDGRPDRSIELKQARGELVVHDAGPRAAQDAPMAAWRADVEAVGIEDTVMIARGIATRTRVNEEARAVRQAPGELAKAGCTDRENSLQISHGAAKESNLPTLGLPGPAGFEDRLI